MAAYGLISWFILNIVSISRFQHQSSIKTTNAFGLLLTIPLIFSLNVWYSAYFIFLYSSVSITLFIFMVIFTKNSKTLYYSIIKFTSILNKRILTFWIFLFLALSMCLLIIYLPQTSSDYNSVNKDFFVAYSPTISSFFDTTGSGGGFATSFYDFLYTKSQVSPEMNLGINPLIFVLFFLTIFIIIKQFRTLNGLPSLFLLSGAIASILVILSLIKILSDISVFSILWDNFSPLRTMRIPIRANIIFNFIAITYVFFLMDKFIVKRGILTKLSLILTSVFLLLDMQRSPNIYWKKSDLIDTDLLAYVDQLRTCNSFVIDREEVEWWKDSIDGLTLSTITKIPTVNGFSSIYPDEYPGTNWTQSSDLAAIINWLQTQNGLTKSCLITHNAKVIFLDKKSVFSSAQQGFTRQEFEDQNSWNWMVHPQGVFVLFNLTSEIKAIKVNFRLKSPSCNYGQKVYIQTSDGTFASTFELENKAIPISFDTSIDKFETLILSFKTDSNSCKVGSDPRDLYLSVNDFELN